MEGLPETTLPEVAFAGRSNVGKSSLINSLTNRTNLARTSRTPGRTREINFFKLNNGLILADLPGFGYAKEPKTLVKQWTRLIDSYLKGRPNLRRTCLLIDSRRGAMKSDLAIMDGLDEAAVSYLIILTKSDKLKPNVLSKTIDMIENILRKRPAAYPSVVATSSKTGHGILNLQNHLTDLADLAATY